MGRGLRDSSSEAAQKTIPNFPSLRYGYGITGPPTTACKPSLLTHTHEHGVTTQQHVPRQPHTRTQGPVTFPGTPFPPPLEATGRATRRPQTAALGGRQRTHRHRRCHTVAVTCKGWAARRCCKRCAEISAVPVASQPRGGRGIASAARDGVELKRHHHRHGELGGQRQVRCSRAVGAERRGAGGGCQTSGLSNQGGRPT